MNAAQNWEEDEEPSQLKELQTVRDALAEHIEQMVIHHHKMGLPAPTHKNAVTYRVKGIPPVDPKKVEAVEMPEDYGKWA